MNTSVHTHLQQQGFSYPYVVTGRDHIDDLFPAQQCGIAVLHFAYGDYAVFATTDITLDFPRIRRRHLDIDYLSFIVLPPNGHPRFLRTLRTDLHRFGVYQRDLHTTSLPPIHPKIDTHFSSDALSRYQQDAHHLLPDVPRSVCPTATGDDSRVRLARLQADAAYPQLVPLVREYVQRTMPAPVLTEQRFWMVTVNTTDPPSESLLVRVDVGWQHTFDVWRSGAQLVFNWTLCRADCERLFGVSLAGGEMPLVIVDDPKRALQVDIVDSALRSACAEPVIVRAMGVQSAWYVLEQDVAVLAMRRVTVNLMRKGSPPRPEYHCLALADLLLDEHA